MPSIQSRCTLPFLYPGRYLKGYEEKGDLTVGELKGNMVGVEKLTLSISLLITHVYHIFKMKGEGKEKGKREETKIKSICLYMWVY